MTPAIKLLRKLGIPFNTLEYTHDPGANSYGEEACEKLGLNSCQVFKTLVVQASVKQLAVAVIPVACQLQLKYAAAAVGVKKVEMADQVVVQRTTGYLLGGISPIGQKRRLPTFLDVSAEDYDVIYVSAGRRGLEVEISPADLLQVTSGQFAKLTTGDKDI